MRYFAALAISLALLTGCQSTQELKPVSQIKPAVAKEGSLANEKLILDATADLQALTGTPIKSSEVLKFVIQQPVGEVGSRAWREMWVVKTPDGKTQFLLTFKEVGLGAADFEITKMENEHSSKKCPKNVAKFPIGETTSDDIVSCMGKPSHEDYNPDGRFVYLYDSQKKIVLAYLFGKDKKLIKVTGYEKTGS
ncbi:YjgB family protein [Shewanella sp. AS16]|uniref:YjgB family protein n=1 Tax=Shewanella sp. AS16 TaxID=2907625 RepID=UPI001F391E8D|nr:YjgB family protein [Shewanella sp. AS16]MCE9684632.1 YjgB family protein [Shewanella sp. AS16]